MVTKTAPLVCSMTGGAPASNPAHIPAPAPGSMEWRADYELYYHYGDIAKTPVHECSFKVTAVDGEVRTGVLDHYGRACVAQLAVGPLQVEYQHDQPEDDTDALIQARAKLKKALDGFVEQTRSDYAEEWKQWDEAWWIERAALLKGNEIAGNIVGAWNWVTGTVEFIWDLMVIAYEIKREINLAKFHLLTHDFDALDQQFQGHQKKFNNAFEKGSQAYELLILIANDAQTRQHIQDTVNNWWAAIPPDERVYLKSKISGEIAMDLIVTVLLAAITAAAGGAGGWGFAGAKVAAAMSRVGGKLAKVINALLEAFEELAKLLKTIKRKTDDTPKPKPLDPKAQTRELETVRPKLHNIIKYLDITGFRRVHILNRHRHGAGKPGKTEFPSTWDDDRIIHNISDIAADPNSIRGLGKWDSPYVTGTRDGIEIRVDFYPNVKPNGLPHPNAGKISTAYPLNTPANPL